MKRIRVLVWYTQSQGSIKDDVMDKWIEGYHDKGDFNWSTIFVLLERQILGYVSVASELRQRCFRGPFIEI
ncbi:hypothetical protein M0804_009796 [Polistes exclamans]|nr:hypothetical protein M0804_009796 [Polistes exclamans]